PNPAYRLKKLPVVADFMDTNKSKSVSYLLNENSYTQQEIDSRKNQLYAQKPILELRHISTWFPLRNGLFGTSNSTIKAVDDISLNVFPGETLGLVGESGCGKTTLGRTILRLIEPTSGDIIFDGNNIANLKPQELRKLRREIQLIFQDPFSALNPRITIGNTLMEPLQVHQLFDTDQQRKTHIQELLKLVGLNPDHFNRYPHEFSGGQRQRIVIARALALQPKFIICDESVSALDVSVQAQVLNLLRDLQKELGLTYIFISHDLAVVKHLSDRMIIMNKGKIEEEGFPENIYNAPKSDYTKRLIAAIPGRK
ncbi:MAG: ATP-binding cassette domain-containing protein, partial [Pedobacter sp.]|nr:ATP-binding cassette domain-containing protein [Pedobacter sp.]